jgi:hypothetical protein
LVSVTEDVAELVMLQASALDRRFLCAFGWNVYSADSAARSASWRCARRRAESWDSTTVSQQENESFKPG